MKKFLILLLILPAQILPQSFDFSEAIPVVESRKKNVFFHLDSSGRKNIAVSRKYTAAVWEDNSSGTSQVYAAFKENDKKQFYKPVQLSTNESFEPVIAAFGEDSFLSAWEENEFVHVCLIQYRKKNKCFFIGEKGSSQPSLGPGEILRSNLVWTTREKDHSRIYHASVREYQGKLGFTESFAVEKGTLKGRQAYPAVSEGKGRIMVVWEDQRNGHTAIYSSESSANGIFSTPVIVNEIIKKSQAYGEAQGTARPVVEYDASKNQFIAVWLDKREFHTGYEVYGAFHDATNAKWNRNFKIQDPFGDGVPQWHSTLTVDLSGKAVSFWDDTREGNSDIWYSYFSDQNASEDFTHPTFSGKRNQTSPSAAVDSNGNIHLIYLERDENGFSSILYVKGSLKKN